MDLNSRRYDLDQSGVFAAILGVEPEAVIGTLLVTKLNVGFAAQELGRGQTSVASSGAIVYSLSGVPSFSDLSLRPLVAEIERWVADDGHLRPSGIRPRADSIWADSQCLLA